MKKQERERNGEFALVIPNKKASRRWAKRANKVIDRKAQVVAENAEWAKSVGLDPNDLDSMFL